MAKKKLKVNVDLDFTAKKTSVEEIKKQIELAVSALEMNIDDNSLKKMKKDLQEIGKIAEKSFNKSTQQIDLKKMGSMIDARDDLASIDTISKSLLQVGVNGTKSFNDIKNAGSFLNKSLTESNSILAKMGTTLMNTIRWNISSSAVNAVTGEFQKMYYFAKDLDRTLTDIRIVSGQSADQMERFAIHANESAKALRVSTVEYAQAATIFFQQGLGDADVKKMTDGAMMASRITGTAASDMADLLTSTMNGYKLAADEVMTVTDKLAAVGATTASNFQELATGMSKVASMANTAGVSVDELNAQLATIIAVTRESPESIGTSLKTIYGRMLMFKTDTKALMKDEDGEVFGAPKVEAALQAYSRVSGAQISLFKTTADGRRELRDLGEVIEEIGDSWDDVTDRTAKFGLATALAGSRQQNRLVALFDSWDMYKDAVETSLNAEGTALKQNAIYMESYEGRLKGLQAAKEELYMVLTDTGSLKDFISMLTKGVELVSSLAEATGGFSAVVGILGASMSKTFATKFQGAGGLSGLTAGKGTDATTDAEIDAKNKLLTINKMLGAEEANRLRNNLKGAQDSQKAHQTMFELMTKEAELIQEIARLEESKLTAASKKDSYDNMDDENKRLMEESTHLIALKAAYADLANAKLEGESLMQRAAEETGEVELAALDKSFDEVATRIDDAQARIDNIKAQVPDIEEKAQEHGRTAGFEKKRVGVASDELNKQFEESQKILKTQRAIQTTMMLLPSVISAATDETKSFGDVAQAGLKMLVPMIPAIVSGVMELPDAFAKASAGASAFSTVMSTSLGPILAVAGAVALVGLAIKAIDNLTVTFKEQKKIVDELSDSVNSLQSEYDSLDANENRTAEQENYLKLLDKELEIKKEILAIEAENLIEKFFEPNKITGYDDSEAAKAKKQMEELKELREELEGLNKKISAPDYIVNEDDTKRIREINGEMLSLETSLIETAKTVQGMSKNLVEASPELDTFARELDKVIYSAEELAERDKWNFAEEVAKQIAEGEKATDGWDKSLMALGFTSEEALSILEGKLNDVKTAYNKVEGSKPSISEESKSLEQLTEEFEEVTNKLQAYNKILEELNSKEGLSAQSKEDIITKYQEFLPYLDDEQELRKQLINIISDEEETQRQAYTNMIMYSEDFFNAKIKGNDTLYKTLGEFYTEDLKNAKSLADAKEIVEASLIKNLSGLWAKYYNAASSNNLAEADYRKKLAFGYGTAEEKAAMSAAINAIDQQKEVARRFDELAKGFASGVDFSGNKGSKSSSTKEEYKAIYDIYAKINLELDKNNVLLAKNKTLQKLAKEGSAEQLALIQEENALYKERQGLLNQLNEKRRAEALKLEKELSKEGFAFEGSGDDRRISNLGDIQGKSEEVEKMVKRLNELRTNLIPQTSQQWWDYQVTIVQNIEKIESAIQSRIDELQKLEQELADFDLVGKIAELDKQLDAAKFNYWIESLILGLERYNDKTELLSFKLSLFDEEDYENRSDVIGDLFNASKDKLKAYRKEWDKLSNQTPKNANEASQIANAMKQVQQGMRDAFVATREYQRELERLQFDSISSEFEKANKQLELQLSIIDHNLQSLQDGILPDFSLDMVMPIPDFSDIFDETASENEKIYREQASFEREIQSLKKQSLEMQLDEAEDFYEEEKAKLIKHYKDLVKQIADKEAKILELQKFADEQQKAQLQNSAIEIQNIVDTDLNTLEGSYVDSWGNIVGTVRDSVAQIKQLVSQANSAIASMGSAPSSSSGGSTGSNSGSSGYKNLNPVVNVNPDGKAPSGLPVGTIVKTGGGDYQITKVKPDGSYESNKVRKYAKGGTHQGGNSLVGEEGIELGLLPSGKAIILGKNGSELVDIPKGTQVIPHEETKDILSHTGNIDGKTIPKYKDGTGEAIPQYAIGTGFIAGIVGAVASTLASTVNKVSGTSAKLKDTKNKLNKANDKIDRLNNKIDDLSNVSYASSTPTAPETSEFDKIIESIKPDFAVGMSSTFKEGYDKYTEDRKVNLQEIADLQKKYLEDTDEQITKEEILAKIDEQMLEDTRTQSWLKVDLLEQMKQNVEEYTVALKEQYDASIESGNTELATQIFEEYNSMLTKQIQIEKQIQSAIKERYTMEFSLIDKKLAKEEQRQSSLEKDLKLTTIQNPDDTDEILRLNEEILQSQINQGNQIALSITGLIAQRDVLEIGSNEWNIINDKIEEYEDSLKDSNISVAEMNKQLAEIERNDLFKQFENRLRESTRLLKVLNYELGLLYEEQRPESLNLMEDKLIAIQNEANITKENLKEFLATIGLDYDTAMSGTYDTTGLAEQQITDLDSLVDKVRESETSIVDLQKAIEQFRVEKVFADLNNSLRNTVHNLEMLGLEMQLLAEDDFDNRINILNQQMKLTNNQIVEQTKAYEELQKVIQQNADERGFITEEELDKLNQAELSLKQLQVELANLEKLKLSNNFSSQLSDIEKQLFDGKTYDEANESLEKKIELENKFIDGLEKELEVQKLKDYAKQNEVALSKEQLKTLNAQGKVEKESLERIQKQLEIKQLEQKLENLKSQKAIQQLTKKADGTWDFMYVADQDEIDNTTRELQDKRVELIQWERNITQESERKQLQDKANYLEKLRQITEKALNGEYETYDEFNNSILLLNETFLTDLTLDSEIKWGELLTTFDEKLLGMKTSYLTYVAEMESLADRLNKALNQVDKVEVTPLPSIIADDRDIHKFATSGKTDKTGYHWLDGEDGILERVLSGQQTKDFNKLVANMPDMLKFLDTDNLSSVLKSAVLSTVNLVTPKVPNVALSGAGGGDIKQNINIDKLEFPNVHDAREIEGAIKHLSTFANQWANQK